MSSIQDTVQIITSVFECVKKENDTISNLKDLREETWFNFGFKIRYFNFTEKSWRNNINQYEHGDDLVIYEDIIPHGTITKNFIDIVLNLFWQHLNMNLGED